MLSPHYLLCLFFLPAPGFSPADVYRYTYICFSFPSTGLRITIQVPFYCFMGLFVVTGCEGGCRGGGWVVG